MRASTIHVDRTGLPRVLEFDIGAHSELSRSLAYLNTIHGYQKFSAAAHAKRMRALRQIGQVLGRPIADRFLAGDRIALRVDGSLGPVHIHQILLYALVETWDDHGVGAALRSMYSCDGEMYELVPGYDRTARSDLDLSEATPENLGIVILSAHPGDRADEVMQVVTRAATIGVECVEVAHVPTTDSAPWRRPNLIVIGHAPRSDRIQVGSGAIDSHDGIVGLYTPESAYQIDFCVCRSRMRYLKRPTPDVRGLIIARGVYSPFEGIYRSVREMLAPSLAHKIVGNSPAFSYLDGNRMFATARYLIYAVLEAELGLKIASALPNWSNDD
jgi:hypothetical protein